MEQHQNERRTYCGEIIKTGAGKVACIAFSIALAVSMPLAIAAPTAAYAEPTTAQRLAAAQEEADAAEAELQRLEGELEEANNELYDVQQQLEVVRGQVEETKAQVEATKQAVAEAQARVDDATDKLNQAAVDQYRSTSNTVSAMLEALTRTTSITQLFSSYYYAQEVSNSQQERIDEFVAARTELENQQAALEAQQAELEAQQAQLEELEAEAASKQAVLESKVGEQEAYYNSLSEQVQELMAQKQREEEEAARRAAEAAARRAASGSSRVISYDPPGEGSYDVGTYSSAVEAALSRQGCPYVWGATGPSAFDCSGLVYWSYAQVGIHLNRTSSSQPANCSSIFYDASQAQAGDLVFFGHPIHHVGICLGGGSYIHAPHSGSYVQIASLGSRGDINCFGRL